MTSTPEADAPTGGAVRQLLRLLADPALGEPPIHAVAALADQLAAEVREEAGPYANAAAALARLAVTAAGADEESDEEATAELAGGLAVFTALLKGWLLKP